jgi:hypothetical protein
MKKSLRLLSSATVGVLISLGFVSCAYDPFYSTSVGSSYNTGFIGGGGSTSLFVSTGDPRWGYDPNCFSYYDYQRRSYYDPYLCGYYPVGCRPPLVVGVPHPFGWSPGHGICRPPVRVTNVTISNFRDREFAYRNSSFGWARQVRQPSVSYYRDTDYGSSSRQRYDRESFGTRSQSGIRQNSEPYFRRETARPELRTPSSGRSAIQSPSRYTSTTRGVRGETRPSSREQEMGSSSGYGDGRVRGFR